jgi:ribosomal protein S18 acetylase RimI-like enzyme
MMALPIWLFRYRSAVVFSCNDKPVPHDHCTFKDGFLFRQAERREADVCSQLSGLPSKEVLRRFSAGDDCYVVFRERVLVHIVWIHYGPCYIRGLKLHLHLSRNDAYVYGIITHPEFRGLGIYKSTQYHLASLLMSGKTDRMIQIVYADNKIPLALLPKIGYQIIGQTRCMTVGGINITSVRLSDRKQVILSKFWNEPQDIYRI